MKKLAAIGMTLALAAACAAPAFASETLPPYAYTGSDPVEAAVAQFTAERGKDFLLEGNAVSVPVPIVLKTEEAEGGDLRVFGNFWVFNYTLEGTVLTTISGGEAPGILTLTRAEDAWQVRSFDEAGSGEEYGKDIARFCAGDKALLDGFYASADGDGELFKSTRLAYLREYVRANEVNAEAYQDYGWDAVPLFDGETPAPEDPLAGKTLTFSSGVGAWYTTLTFEKDGLFTGEYHDSEMGETGEGYPDGTVYGSLFPGRAALEQRPGDPALVLTVLEAESDEGQVPEAVEDGIRYVTTAPYGLKTGDEMVVYLPGTPVDSLPEGLLAWCPPESVGNGDALPFTALWNAAADAGFVEETGN